MTFTPEELREWAHNPITKFHITKLIEVREDEKEKLASNYYKDFPQIQRSVGICQSLEATIDSIQSLKQEVKDAE
jgi:hypothetical protein